MSQARKITTHAIDGDGLQSVGTDVQFQEIIQSRRLESFAKVRHGFYFEKIIKYLEIFVILFRWRFSSSRLGRLLKAEAGMLVI